MIRPPEIEGNLWDAITAAAGGDVPALRRLLEQDPNLHGATYWYTSPLHFAVREGQLEAVRLLLESGADPSVPGLQGDDLATIARDRNHDAVAALLEEALARRRRTAPAGRLAPEHPIHAAAAADDVEGVRRMLDADPQLVHRGDHKGGTPLHRAAAASARRAAALLLDRGADIHAVHGSGPGDGNGYAPAGFQAIDLALWSGPHSARGDFETARLLLEAGAARDVVISAALGEDERVTALLDEEPTRIRALRPSGIGALSAAVGFGNDSISRLLLERGADPNWPEEGAPRGAALYIAARDGDRAMVELLLAHGADPNSSIESSGNATYAASTPELRSLLISRGGTLDTYDLVFLDDDDEVVRRVAADPRAADTGCGGALAAACTRGKRELVARLLEAGARVPPMLTACRGYLLADPGLLRLLLASGMNPDLPNWQRQTPLHDLCNRDTRGRANPHREECASILLDAGANLSAKDDDYRSTPLAWASRNNLPEMVELLLARGAPTTLPDDEPWATPLAWATRRGHARIVDILHRAAWRS